jgi:hypothetical protein
MIAGPGGPTAYAMGTGSIKLGSLFRTLPTRALTSSSHVVGRVGGQ